MVLCNYFHHLRIHKTMSDTNKHSLHTQTHTKWKIIIFKWEVSTNHWFLNRTDLFSLTFNLCQYQSCCRIKWSLIELDTIIKRHCDPRLRSDFERNGVKCFWCARRAHEWVCQRDHSSKKQCLYLLFCDSLEQVLTNFYQATKTYQRKFQSLNWNISAKKHNV